MQLFTTLTTCSLSIHHVQALISSAIVKTPTLTTVCAIQDMPVGIVTSAVLDALSADGNEDWPDNDVVLYEPCESKSMRAYACTQFGRLR